jgi:spore photoproduct lyase
MAEDLRSRKLTKFGSVKYVYPAALMREMRGELTGSILDRLPSARVL